MAQWMIKPHSDDTNNSDMNLEDEPPVHAAPFMKINEMRTLVDPDPR